MISIICAMGANRAIGKSGQLPWSYKDYPEDMARFRRITMGHVVLMGRKTYDSIGKPLPGRTNIVLSKRGSIQGTHVFSELSTAIEFYSETFKPKNLYIIGGQNVYEQSMDLADELRLTQLDKEFEADTFFPEIGKEWERIVSIHIGSCKFTEYEKIRPQT